MKKSTVDKILFGMRLRYAREKTKLNLQQFSSKVGCAVSYLNEIEHGKKYPGPDKLEAFAGALGTTVDQLLHDALPPPAIPMEQILRSGILDELPLHRFGIEPMRILELMQGAPTQVTAFLNTLVDLARHHSVTDEHIFTSALRSYQELHQNYFPELEAQALHIRSQILGIHIGIIPSIDLLELALKNFWGIHVRYDSLLTQPRFRYFSSWLSSSTSTLWVQESLPISIKKYILSREIAFQHLALEDRISTSPPFEPQRFHQVIDYFHASYLANAIGLPESMMQQCLHTFFHNERLQPQLLVNWIQEYEVTPAMFFARFHLILPWMHWKHVFYIKAKYHSRNQSFDIERELHLHPYRFLHLRKHQEHYCLKWPAFNMLQLESNSTPEVQVYLLDIGDPAIRFLTITYLYQDRKEKNTVTIAVELTETIEQSIPWISELKSKIFIARSSCERCNITDCDQRRASPIHLEHIQRRHEIRKLLEEN